MRFLAIILSITILLLAISPGLKLSQYLIGAEQATCSSHCCAQDDSIDTNNAEQDDREQDDKEQSPCTPFQNCCSFVIQEINSDLIGIKCPERWIKPCSFYTAHFSSQFAADVWQPPKIA